MNNVSASVNMTCLILKASESDRQQQLEARLESERNDLLEKVRLAEEKEASSSETAKAAEAELANYKARHLTI